MPMYPNSFNDVRKTLRGILSGQTRLKTPADLARIPVGWWDTADINTLTLNSTNVAGFNNKGSAGGTLIQNSASQQPKYSATARNGLPGLVFTGSSKQFITLGNTTKYPAGSAPTTMFSVGMGSGYIAGYGGNNTNDDRLLAYGNPIKLDAFGSAQTLTESSATLDAIVAWALNGTASGNSLGYVNGGSAEVGSLTPHTASPAEITLGRPTTVDGGYFTGVLQEFLIFDYILSDADQRTVEGYLAWKWALQALLPANHPRKNGAPIL